MLMYIVSLLNVGIIADTLIHKFIKLLEFGLFHWYLDVCVFILHKGPACKVHVSST